MGKWCNLPVDLLNAVEDHLVLYGDKVRIRVVCVEWNSYLSKLPNNQLPNQAKQLPWLLYPLDNHEEAEATHGLFNPLDEKVYNIYLPEAQVKLFKGSSYGWIATVEDFHSPSGKDINLINPLTRAQIKLPPRTEFADVVRYTPGIEEEFVCRMFYDIPNFWLHADPGYVDELEIGWYDLSLDFGKVVMSSTPSDECVVVAIYGQASQLAWCRCNDKKWTHIFTGISGFLDTLFCKGGLLYALNDEGRVFLFENIGTNSDIKLTEIKATRIPILEGKSAYLAECSDGSLVVVVRQFYYDRNLDKTLPRTVGFHVYKLDSTNSTWVEVNDIGNDILFVGFGSARSTSSSHDVGYKRNHIYFSHSDRAYGTLDDNKNSDSDEGCFNLQDGALESLRGLQHRIWPRPIWMNIG